MPKTLQRLTVAIALVLVLTSCKQESQRAFYYWKTTYNVSKGQRELLQNLNVNKLYIRLFDVDVDRVTGVVTPVATIRFKDSIDASFNIVPVVFITNRSLQATPKGAIDELTDKIMQLVNTITSSKNINFSELQIDCDWSDGTRVKFFSLLERVRAQLRASGKELSVTIRLHQVKYKDITGVPPADRGMLMFYNMGKIDAESSSSSIYSFEEASKYVNHCKDYPLPLDVALPAFSWGIHTRNGRVVELLSNMSATDFEDTTLFLKQSENYYTATHSFFFRGYYFMKDDGVKVESVTPKDCLMAAKQLRRKLPKSVGTVAIFHLDTLIPKRYEQNDFEKVFNLYHW